MKKLMKLQKFASNTKRKSGLSTSLVTAMEVNGSAEVVMLIDGCAEVKVVQIKGGYSVQTMRCGQAYDGLLSTCEYREFKNQDRVIEFIELEMDFIDEKIAREESQKAREELQKAKEETKKIEEEIDQAYDEMCEYFSDVADLREQPAKNEGVADDYDFIKITDYYVYSSQGGCKRYSSGQKLRNNIGGAITETGYFAIGVGFEKHDGRIGDVDVLVRESDCSAMRWSDDMLGVCDTVEDAQRIAVPLEKIKKRCDKILARIIG